MKGGYLWAGRAIDSRNAQQFIFFHSTFQPKIMKTPHIFSRFSLMASFIAVLFFSSCDLGKVTTLIEPSIAKLKSSDYNKFMGVEVKVSGYMAFDEEGGAMLVSDLKVLESNNAMDEAQYIRLDKQMVQELLAQSKDEFWGARVEMKAVVQESKDNNVQSMKELLGASSVVELRLKERPLVIAKRPQDWKYPTVIDICKINPLICHLSTTIASNHYALLFSGGVNAANAHARYWNDLKYMYQTLKKAGYSDDKIVVVYKDGNPGDATGEVIVDYPASIAGVDNAFAFLAGKLDGNDQLFFFATNHGGGYHVAEGVNYGGLSDSDGDEIDAQRKDETIYYYNEAGQIADDLLKTKINSLGVGVLIAVLEPCFSGGLLRDLSGDKRIICTAANEFEFSWSRAGGLYDEFSYHFTAALNGNTPEGGVVNADLDGDGKISIYEAYRYAQWNDTAAEHPQYDDNGNQIGTAVPVAGGTSDGAFGAGVFL